MLLHVMDSANQTGQPNVVDPLDWQMRKAEAENYMRDLALRLHEAGLPTERHVLEGHPAGWRWVVAEHGVPRPAQQFGWQAVQALLADAERRLELASRDASVAKGSAARSGLNGLRFARRPK